MAKILIADDEILFRLLLERTLEELEDEGVELIFAEDGEEALKLICEEKTDLVFLDLIMPGLTGLEICHAVKKVHCMRDVFIIMLTSRGEEYDRQKGKETGADIYYTKPFDPDEISGKAREILGL